MLFGKKVDFVIALNDKAVDYMKRHGFKDIVLEMEEISS